LRGGTQGRETKEESQKGERERVDETAGRVTIRVS
jgi:hypothetical protein